MSDFRQPGQTRMAHDAVMNPPHTPPDTALLLIDIQSSFTRRPYWQDDALAPFLHRVNALATGCAARGVPLVRIWHTDGPDTPDNPFAQASGCIRPLPGLVDLPIAATFEKHRHSALVGTGLGAWLLERALTRLIVCGIRTEQCCETTTRHASDEGWAVDFVSEATLTFDMRTPAGALLNAAAIIERTETVLAGRFARIRTVEQTLHGLDARGHTA
jgi:nicotinamidase-related amidase